MLPFITSFKDLIFIQDLKIYTELKIWEKFFPNIYLQFDAD